MSSFGAAVRHVRNRADRRDPDDPIDQFERFLVAAYGWQKADAGYLRFYDVERGAVPRNRRPTEDETVDLTGALDIIRSTYDARNNPPFDWADA